MSIELIGERAYSNSIKEAQGAWLLMEKQAIFLLKEDQGNALPTWATKKEADNFSKDIEGSNLKPVFFPLSSLLHGILSKTEYQLVAVLASPRYGEPALTYSKEEYFHEFNT
jgi:hypothetical protein